MAAFNFKLGGINMADINKYAPRSGRLIKEDGSEINIADFFTKMEYYGPTVTERPAANSVPVGAIYIAVNTQEAWMSNGTDWVVA